MALQDLLANNNKNQKLELSEERVTPLIPVLRQYIAFWREYPDIFIDFLAYGKDGEVGTTTPSG